VRELLFVYNVDLTPVALVSDFIHRITSPETYPCRLCDLTYDRFTMKREWKRFLATLQVRTRFELRDGFRRKFPAHADVPLPAIFEVGADDTLQVLVSAEMLTRVSNLADLEGLLMRVLNSRGQTRART